MIKRRIEVYDEILRYGFPCMSDEAWFLKVAVNDLFVLSAFSVAVKL